MNTKKRSIIDYLALPVILLCAVMVWAAVPGTITYQGRLTDSGGMPVNGTVPMTFGLFASEIGGSTLWSETQDSVTVNDGIYNVELGKVNPINLDFNTDYWLQVIVNGEALTPRSPLSSVPYAFRAEYSNDADSSVHTRDEIYAIVENIEIIVQDTNNKVNSCAGPPVPVPKTGQTTSYATGDDGDLQKGLEWPSPRFTDNGDGTVTDNMTNLIWLKDANCFGQQNWTTALNSANTLNSGECGLSDGSIEGDWRLPNVRELASLVDYGQYNPPLPSGHPFTGVQSGNYWSSSTYLSMTNNAWYVQMSSGVIYIIAKTNSYWLWPVRGGN